MIFLSIITYEVDGKSTGSDGRFSATDRDLILEALKNSCVCSFCNRAELDELAKDVDLKVFKEGDIVCEQDKCLVNSACP